MTRKHSTRIPIKPFLAGILCSLICHAHADTLYRTLILPTGANLMPAGEYAIDWNGEAQSTTPMGTTGLSAQHDTTGQHSLQSKVDGKTYARGTYAENAQRVCVKYGTPKVPGYAKPMANCKTTQSKGFQRTRCDNDALVITTRALSASEWEVESTIKTASLSTTRGDSVQLARMMQEMAKDKAPEEQARMRENVSKMEAMQANMATQMAELKSHMLTDPKFKDMPPEVREQMLKQMNAPTAAGSGAEEIHTRERYTLVSKTCSR